jgi:hypothetical protein
MVTNYVQVKEKVAATQSFSCLPDLAATGCLAWPIRRRSQHRKSLENKAFCGFAFRTKNEYYFFK